MKKLFVFFICLLAINGLMAQKRVFDTISFIRGGRVYKLKLYLDRITINDTTCYSFPGFGTSHTTCAYGDHNHSGVYEPSITKSIGFLKWSGSTWFFDPSVYSPVFHNHDGTYEPVIHYGHEGQYWDGNKTWRELNAGAVGLGNVSNIAQVTSVTGTAPVFSTGGTTPDISMPQATTSQSGYLSYLDWQTFNNKVSSQWTPNGFDLYYMKGKVGIGLTNPAYTSDVYGTANVYDYKSAENYVSKMNVKQGNASLSGIWSSATDSVPSKMPTKDVSEEKSSGYIYNTSFIANPFLGAYMYFYSRDYNYQVGLFDRMGHKKAFCGIMGGGMPTQPFVNLGSSGYPWGKGYFADSISAQAIKSTGISNTGNITTTGFIGVGLTNPTNVFQAESSIGPTSMNLNSLYPVQTGTATQTIAQVNLSHLSNTAYARLVLRYDRDNSRYEFLQTLYAYSATRAFQYVNMLTGAYEMRAGITTVDFANSGNISFSGGGDVQIGSNVSTGHSPLQVTMDAAVHGATISPIYITSYSTGGAQTFTTLSAQGTKGTPLALGDMITMGGIGVRGYDGTAWSTNRGGFNLTTDGAWTSTSHGTQTVFKHTAPGSTAAPTERFRITSVGVGIATAGAPTAALDVNSNILRLRGSKTPSSCTDAGNTGDICWDDKYVYVCVATNIWRRTATSLW